MSMGFLFSLYCSLLLLSETESQIPKGSGNNIILSWVHLFFKADRNFYTRSKMLFVFISKCWKIITESICYSKNCFAPALSFPDFIIVLLEIEIENRKGVIIDELIIYYAGPEELGVPGFPLHPLFFGEEDNNFP